MKLKFKGNVVIENRDQLEEIGRLLDPTHMWWEYYLKENYGATYYRTWNGEYGTYSYQVNHTTQTITVLEVL